MTKPNSYYYAPGLDLKSRRELVTPEGIDLEVNLASGGARFGAFVIDLIIMVVALIALTFAIAFMSELLFGDVNEEITEVIWILIFFILRNFYFTLFEIRPKAATPGKRIVKIRVAARTGERLTAPAVFARNAMRELEFFLPLGFVFITGDDVEGAMGLLGLIWGCVFLMFPLFNKDRLRAGDLIAGTWVLEAPRALLIQDLAANPRKSTQRYKFTAAQVKAYGVHELHVLEDVIRRNDIETLKAVSSRIREKIKWTRETSENDREFLQAYYGALRKQLETQLMMGKRRKDKFDV